MKINTTRLEEVKKNYSPKGLTSKQANEKIKKFGENTFIIEQVSGFRIWCKQFMNPLTGILLFSTALSFFMEEYSDGLIILSIVFLNACLSFIQEFRSGKAVEKLSHLIEKQTVVVRDDKQMFIDVKELVPGDVVILKGGDVVPADMQIMDSNNLSVNESQLTGESRFVTKNENAKNLLSTVLFSGSLVEKGYCKCVVFATGNHTELGKVAQLSKHTKKVTPYQKSLTAFSMSLLRMIGVTIILMITAKISLGVDDVGEMILFAVALAMTVVPEALPMVTTINFSHGALQLAKQKVIVKKLSAVEDLGKIDVLCTDKTGTLTQNCLTISEMITNDKEFFQTLAYATIEDAQVTNKKYNHSYDAAFLAYIPKNLQEKENHWHQLKVMPFDPEARRRRIVVQNSKDKRTYLVVLGAAETLLDMAVCETRSAYQKSIAKSSKNGMRQLAIAYKEITYTDSFDILQNEKDLKFLGFVTLMDPLCETSQETIHLAKKLGIDIKILTGDSVGVATYIGKQTGLLKKHQVVYTGDQLEQMSPTQLQQVVKKGSVFARVTPAQKYKIIEQLKNNHVVGYMGDGINDAPALHVADVAVAVNNATDVAKDSADIILVEDDLEVIIKGIQYGRSIFVNVNKYIKHAMIGNIGNFFSLVFFYVAFSADLPMLPIQLLIANLIQDMPLMIIYSDSVDEQDICFPQKNSKIKQIMKSSLYLGIFTTIYYILYFLFVGTEANALTRTNLFLFFNITQLLIIVSIRNKKFFWQGTKPSKLLTGTILFFIIVSLLMPYTPVVSTIMGLTSLSFVELGGIIGVSLAYILLLDVFKIGIQKYCNPEK